MYYVDWLERDQNNRPVTLYRAHQSTVYVQRSNYTMLNVSSKTSNRPYIRNLAEYVVYSK